MYNPIVGRWMEEDPIEFQAGDDDLYRYVGNNGTDITDPSGLVRTIDGWTVAVNTVDFGSLSDKKISYGYTTRYWWPPAPWAKQAWLLTDASGFGLMENGQIGPTVTWLKQLRPQRVAATVQTGLRDFVLDTKSEDRATRALGSFFDISTLNRKLGDPDFSARLVVMPGQQVAIPDPPGATPAHWAIFARTITKFFGFDDGKNLIKANGARLTQSRFAELLRGIRKPKNATTGVNGFSSYSISYLYVNTKYLRNAVKRLTGIVGKLPFPLPGYLTNVTLATQLFGAANIPEVLKVLAGKQDAIIEQLDFRALNDGVRTRVTAIR